MGVFDQYPQAVLSVLQQRGVNGDCPMCKKKEWIIHDRPAGVPVFETEGQLQFTGTSLPVAVVICKNCGYTASFSLGALGLIGNNGAPAAAAAPVAPAADAKN